MLLALLLGLGDPVGPNVQVSAPSTATQVWPAIAVDPADRNHLVATGDDWGGGAAVFYVSSDAGRTWSEWSDAGGRAAGCAFGVDGEIYFDVQRTTPYASLDLYVGRSDDGGASVAKWVLVDKADWFLGGLSTTSAAVDRTSGASRGYAYLGYTEAFEGMYSWVKVARSTDGGKVWSGGVTLNDDSLEGASAPSIAVDSDGTVRAVFYNVTTFAIAFDSSTNGGASWGTDVPIAYAAQFDVPGLVTTIPHPQIAIDTSGGPHDGTLYVVWAQPGATVGPDVVLSRSTDHGATWSTPIVVSKRSAKSQYTPSIVADELGNVAVGYYDCRGDTKNRRVNYFVSRSSDGGSTFPSIVKVSDADFDPTTIADGRQIVVRTAIAASDRTVHAMWTDGRNGDADLYTASLDLGCYTDVDELSAAAGGTVSFSVEVGPLYGSDVYQIAGTASGTTPGMDFFFVNVPINFDAVTIFTLVAANSAALPGFFGSLDAAGMATASLVTGPLPPAASGLELDFAAFTPFGDTVRWSSSATHLTITD